MNAAQRESVRYTVVCLAAVGIVVGVLLGNDGILGGTRGKGGARRRGPG